MEFETQHITQLTSTIWEATLGLTIVPGIKATPPASRSIAVCVQITGTWNGAVLLDCSHEVARRAASIMFRVDEPTVTLSELQESVAELVNMIGGNLKALLPDHCFLSLPAVVEGSDLSASAPGSRSAVRVTFQCEGHPLAVSIRETCAATVAA